MSKKCRFALCVGICALFAFAQNAYAQNQNENSQQSEFFIPAVYAVEGDWRAQNYDFTNNAPPAIITTNTDDYLKDNNAAAVKAAKSKLKSDDENMADKLMKKIPYSKSLKYTWDVVDGDVDLGVKNLRMDRGNMGVSYKTNALPMLGDMDGSQIKAELGRSSKVTFESDYMPMVGRIDGLQFKASTGTSKSTLSLRYKTDITW